MEINVFIPVIAALAGAVIGALLKELGTFYQSHREDKRTLKKVLFNQLDIWLEVKRFDFRPLVLIYIERWKNRLREEGALPEQIDMLMEGIQPQLELVLQRMKLGEPAKLQQRYQDAVNELAKVDPLLAYRLSGKPDLEETQEKIAKFLDDAMELGKNEATIKRDEMFRNLIESTYKEKILKNTLDALEKDILRVSRKISYFTLFQAYRTFKRLEKRINNQARLESDKMIDNIITFAKSTAAKTET